MFETLQISQEDGIAVVRIKNPTMAPQFFRDVGAAFVELNEDEALKCVIIQSDAKVFSYGLDLVAAMQEHGQELSGGGLAGQRTKLLKLIRSWQGCFQAVADCPVPVIAAVHGWCIGGGLDLISAADIRLASEDARISLRETRIAIVADLGSLQRLQGIVGRGHVREMAFTGGDWSAEEARAIGLVNRVAADKEQLWADAWDMANAIAKNAPLTVRGVKEVLAFSERNTVSDGLEFVAAWNSAFLASEDLGEAVQAFMARREPEFKGR
jgi:enoyl-CoA hydratase